MQKLTDGMLLYHGSYTSVPRIDLSICKSGLDWLHFVAANRDNSLFPRLIAKFASTDIIGGHAPHDRKVFRKKSIPFDKAFFQFTKSYIYDALFDFSTGIWMEGPDYLMALYEEALETPVGSS